jgi:cytoskeleton protein RodZ
MNEMGLDGEAADVPVKSASEQAGVMLKNAREAQGLHIAALAVALKVPVRKLEALEAGRFDLLPDMVFVRSLALSVCRTLKVDSAPILASLPEPKVNHFIINETGLNTTFKDAPGTSRHGFVAQVSSPLGLGVMFLIVAIAAILVWPDKSPFQDEPQAPKESVESVPVAEPPALMPLGSASSSDAAVSPAASNAPQAAPLPVVAEPQATTASKVPAVTQPVAASSPASETGSEMTTSPSVLELVGHGESWVDVTDAAGQSKFRRLVHDGEIIRLTGQLPLSVVVGRADKVSVTVRGKPMDLIPLARENVARFEVK